MTAGGIKKCSCSTGRGAHISEYISCVPNGLCCLLERGRQEQHLMAEIRLFFLISFYFPLLFGCFVLWTLHCFMTAVFYLPGGVCLCAAEAATLPKGRENLGFA